MTRLLSAWPAGTDRGLRLQVLVAAVEHDADAVEAPCRNCCGFPLTDELSTPNKPGRYTHFQGGSIYWSASTGARAVHGSIRDKWASMGWENSFLGFPLTDELLARDPNSNVTDGRVTFFEGGSVYFASANGSTTAYPVGRQPLKKEAVTLSNLPSLADFMSVQRYRSRQDSADPLDWSNNGCSGPTWADIERFFYEPCVRHDFGWRNFQAGLVLDRTSARKDRVDGVLLYDARSRCAAMNQPRLFNGLTYWPCEEAANVVWAAVRSWSGPW